MKKLRKAIRLSLGLAAISTLPGQALAFGGATFDIGTFTGVTLNSSSSAPYKSWTDYGATVNLGWVHSTAWATLQIGSAADILNGTTYDVTLTMTGAGNNGLADVNTLDNPAFSVWTGGTNPVTTGGGGFHEFNQLRGPSGPGEAKITNNALTTGGVIAGSDGWVGYANAGFVITNSDGDTVDHGGVNTSSPWLTSPGTSSWSYSQLNQNDSSSALDYASLTLMGLKSGYYLLALGGSCGGPNPESNCGAGQNFTFSVATAPVPVPSAAWLFGGAIAGLIGTRKRKVL
ncbi:hypothetical protein [Methylomonas sp. MgM2]